MLIVRQGLGISIRPVECSVNSNKPSTTFAYTREKGFCRFKPPPKYPFDDGVNEITNSMNKNQMVFHSPQTLD